MKQFFVFTTILSILLPTGGCRVKKSVRKEWDIIRTDSVKREQTLLLQSAIQQKQASHLRTVIKEIRLSFPDSLHRQYIHSVLLTETEQTTADSLSVIQQIKSCGKEEKTGREITRIKEEQTIRPTPAGRPGFVILLLFIIYIFTKKTRLWVTN
ncbi:MAG: hypothetical protein LUH10_06990 [Tannerellaceae bacterium]|nr:hypothetical protein [Tannerellaceae bacterium]